MTKLIVTSVVTLVILLAALALFLYKKRPTIKPNHVLVRLRPKRWMVLVWSSAIAVMSALVLVAQVLDRKTEPTSMTWIHKADVQVTLVVVLATMTLTESLRDIWRRVSAKKESDMRREIRNNLGAAIAGVCEVAGVKPGSLGCGLFVLQRRWWREDRLVRVERLRLLDTVPESGVSFTKGKGTVGECWGQNRRAHHSWTAINKRHEGSRPTEEKWKGLPERTRHGFTFEEWNTMLGRYAEVLAMPVTVKGTFLAVVALDRQWERDTPDTPDRLRSGAVESAVGGIARVLDPVLAG